MTQAPSRYRGPSSLAELEDRLRWDLERIEGLPPSWPREQSQTDQPLLDVAVVGAGMAGLTTGFALIRQGLRNIQLFDRAREGQEGPWVTYARMETLRSPKHLAGPALGLASLTFRAWYEAQFGTESWEALGKIPRPQWMDYLNWYRRVTAVPVENEATLYDLDGDATGVTAHFRTKSGEKTVRARYLVLANGRDGLGGPFIPEPYRSLHSKRVAHSADEIDFAALRGKRIAVIGAGASAIDNAAEALEAGAAAVTLMVRRRDIPRINKSLAANSPGFAKGFRALEPAARIAINHYFNEVSAPPPKGSMLRASRHGAFAVWTDCRIDGVREENGEITLSTNRGELACDQVILGTGFSLDWGQRPELARLAGAIMLWRDAAMPDMPAGFGEQPFLGQGMEFLPRAGTGADWVTRVYCMNNAATMSHGRIAGDIPGISIGAERVAEHITETLFASEWRRHLEALERFEMPELTGEEWTETPVGQENARPASLLARSKQVGCP
jgi:cation diffusion facilitator CzcD-associated flavoprotein CzcO